MKGNKRIAKLKKPLTAAVMCILLFSLFPAVQSSILTANSDELGVIHTYGDPEETGSIGVYRSDGSIVTYQYEAKPTCVKFENGNPQLGEDDPYTVGLTDTFNITFYGGALPVSGEIKSGAGEQYFTIYSVGETINIYYYSTLTYNITLVSITNGGNTFSFKVESITKPGNTALSHVDFCFSEAQPTPDILVIKKVWNGADWVDSASFSVGEDIDFKLNITNTGTIDLQNVVVTDDLPSFLVYNYDADPTHDTASDHHIEWNIGTLSIGQSKIINFSAEAISTGEDDNFAEACGEYPSDGVKSENKLLNMFEKLNGKSKLFEVLKVIFERILKFIESFLGGGGPIPPPETICDSDTAHVIVTTCSNPDVEIIKKVWNGADWVDSASFFVGDNIDFKLTITNIGNVVLDDYVHVDDDLPGFLTYNYDANLTPTSASDHHIEWHDLAPLAVDAIVEITFSAHADSVGEGDNTACVEAKYDCMPYVDDCDTAHVTVVECPSPDIELIKKVWNGSDWVDSASFTIGDDIQFKIVINNIGNVDLTLFIEDDLPSFLTYNYDANYTPTLASDHHIEWYDMILLGSGKSVEITFSAHADSEGEDDNLASVDGYYDEGEPPVSDSDTAHIIVTTCPSPDVEIIKKVWNGADWVDSASFYVGDDVEFKLIITNTGNVPLDNYVHVDDDLPAFLSFNDDANITPTSLTLYHIEWHDLAPLGVDESIEITFSAHADSIGEGDNSVSVEGKYDCMAPVSDSDSVHIIVECTPPPEPDVEIIKKVWNGEVWTDSASFYVGDDIQFKLVVTNIGDVVLDNYVHVDDDLPGFLTYNYDANLTPTSASDHHIEWHDLAPLAVDARVEITFSAHADSVGEGDNTACVEAKYDCMPYVDDCDIAHIIVRDECEDEPPVTVKEYGNPFFTNGVDDWITTSTPIWLNATDYPIENPSGVHNTFYRISKWNGASWDVEVDWTVYTGPFNVPSECKHKIEFYSGDNCCNTEEIKWQIVYVDDTPPESRYTVTHDPDHYVCRVSTLTISAEDKGLCAVGDYTIYVYVDGHFYKKATNNKVSFQFNEHYGFDHDGKYVITFWAVDALGNKEPTHTENFIIDNKGPSVSKSFIGYHEQIDFHWHISSSTQIQLTASDSGVGVDYIKYRIGTSSEGGSWQTYTGPFTTNKENVYYYARDKLGNQGGLYHLYATIVD